MTGGMCDRCKNDAAHPNSDLCPSCLADVPAIEHTAQVIHLTRKYQPCMADVPWCRPWEPCPDCAEQAWYGGSDAA